MHPNVKPRQPVPLVLPTLVPSSRAPQERGESSATVDSNKKGAPIISSGEELSTQLSNRVLPFTPPRLPRCVEARLVAAAAHSPRRLVSVGTSDGGGCGALTVVNPSTRDLKVQKGVSTTDGTDEYNALLLLLTHPTEEASFSDSSPTNHLNAFRAMSSRYKGLLAERDAEISALRSEAASTAPGGVRYAQLQDELEWTQSEMRALQTKVNSLVKLLDRAGATIRHADEKRGSLGGGGLPSTSRVGSGGSHSGGGGMGRVDWGPMRSQMRDLFMQERSDSQIVASIAQYIKKLTAQITSLESASEGSNNRFAEMEAQKEALIRKIQQQQKEMDDLKDELHTLKRGGGGFTSSGEGVGELATLRQEFEQERARLLHQITSLETAMRNTVDSRPYFVALGKAMSVPPFLRHDGRVRNVALSKTIVENTINAVWLTRFLPTLEECEAFEEAGLSAEARRKGTKAILDVLNETSALSKALEHTFARISTSLSRASLPVAGCGLADYDNLSLWSIRRSEVRRLLSFQDHLARFFVELCRPDKMSTIFNQYEPGRGISTPPVSDVARQARAVLLMCAPQGTTLMRPAATVPPEVAEVTYSLMDGCDRYSFDADVDLFRRIVKGQLPEAAFYDQMIMLQKLRVALTQSGVAEREEVREAAGIGVRQDSAFSALTAQDDGSEEALIGSDDVAALRPTVGSVLRMLRKFFPAKSPDEFRLLQRALLLDVKAISLDSEASSVQKGALGGMGVLSPSLLALEVDVRSLFASNDSGNQGYFLEAVRNQHLESLSTYMSEVQCAVLSLLQSSPPSGGGSEAPKASQASERSRRVSRPQPLVPLILIRDKVSEIDPLKPRTDVNLYLYHLLQLLYGDRAKLNAPDADLIHKSMEEWFEPPLCYHQLNVEELSRYCPLVLCKRCGPAPLTITPAVVSK